MPNAVIWAVVLTLNEQRHIVDCLRSLAWADARLVFDSRSTDETVARAESEGAVVARNTFVNYAQQRNDALRHVQAHAGGDAWVFFLDADERCTPALAAEIRALIATGPATPVWSVPRHNYLFGKQTKGAGWFPDYQARLFHVGAVWFDPAREVHEVALYDHPPGLLKEPLTHFNYDDVAQFHRKQLQYAAYDAGILFKQGVRPKLRNFVLQPLREFRRRFISLGGWRDGAHGLRLSLLTARYNFEMYRLLARRWRTHDGT